MEQGIGGVMKFVVRKYYSGYCCYEIQADNEEQAYEMVGEMPVNYNQILETLEDWEECNEIESVGNT